MVAAQTVTGNEQVPHLLAVHQLHYISVQVVDNTVL